MLKSIALIMLIGMSTGWVCRKVKLPGLLGMLFTGIILGPYVLNMLDSSILLVSADIRKIALVIILTRAGLTLNLEDLKKVGRPAFLIGRIITSSRRGSLSFRAEIRQKDPGNCGRRHLYG